MTMASPNPTKFDPSKYVKTAAETWKDRVSYQKFLRENDHLALPFHVRGLEAVVPPQYPGELAIYLGRSHQGKSTALRDVTFQAQKRIEGKPGALVGLVSLEDTSENTASKQVRRYGGQNLAYEDDQFVFVGNSFSMSLDDMAELNVTNIINSLDYARRKKFASEMQYAHIGIDYAQIIPPDPERRMMTNNDQKRLQVADDVMRLYHAAKMFKCPVGLASQALIKQAINNYTGQMKIPGVGDAAEAKELYSIPDCVYSYWFPKFDHPIGSRVSEGQWSFTVEANLVFVRILKRRNAEEMGFADVVGRVFPCWIEKDGSFVYDVEKHKKMYLMPMENK